MLLSNFHFRVTIAAYGNPVFVAVQKVESVMLKRAMFRLPRALGQIDMKSKNPF